MRFFLTVLVFWAIGQPIFSQNEPENAKPPKARKTEIGLNITSTLAGFFNSGGDKTPADPFLFSLKIGGKKSALRVGVNVRTNQKDEATTGLDGSRTTFDSEVFARVGWEKRQEISQIGRASCRERG